MRSQPDVAALLDVNTLIALLDIDHRDHEAAHRWAEERLSNGWATCATTQMGFLRVISQPGYPSPITVDEAGRLLRRATDHPSHEYWSSEPQPCAGSVSLDVITGHRQITDAYLLALAVHQNGCLVTFDRHITTRHVPGAGQEHLVRL